MADRFSGKAPSFEILGRSSVVEGTESIPLRRSIPDFRENGVSKSLASSSREEPRDDRKRRKRREAKMKKKEKKMKNKAMELSGIPRGDDSEITKSTVDSDSVSGFDDFRNGGNTLFENGNMLSVGRGNVVAVVEEETVYRRVSNFGELRQRSVNESAGVRIDDVTSESRIGRDNHEEASVEKPILEEQRKQRSEPNGSTVTGLEAEGFLDLRRLMAKDATYESPWKFFLEEVYTGNSLRSTTTVGNEKEREKVYDTIFRLPWRCEALINVGFFVCFNSFLSVLTIMPIRVLSLLWRTCKKRQFQRPSAAELSDCGCFLVLACGIILLGWTDISLIYHMIRGQGAIKLYVVYNVLEIFDKLCLSLCADVFQTLFSTAEGLATSSPESTQFWILRFISDQALAMAASILHSFILLAQAITLSTCIVAHNNALLALLVSNNFAEIKSNVFKRFSKDNIHSLVYSDSIERFHIFAFLLFVLAQNILEADGPWFGSFLFNASLVFFCEVLIDIIKHSFLAKFNSIKPIAYSEFLEELCKQTLNIQTEESKKTLTFIPLAPACVVFRVLTPVFVTHLPCDPIPWRLFWTLIMFAMTFAMLMSLKVLISHALQKHAAWYVNRCQKRKSHLHLD